MQVKVDLTKKDFTDFQWYHFKTKGLKKLLVFVVIFAFALPYVTRDDSPFSLMAYGKEVLFTGAFFGLLTYFGMKLSIRFSVSRYKDLKTILGERIFTITEEGLTEEAEYNTTLQHWDSITSVESDDKGLYLYISSIQAYIIPKRSFNSKQEMDSFKENIESRIIR
jgi:hypothetical protein